ncbi:hypothetical protein ACFE04_018704 [Oxalis oulophora]
MAGVESERAPHVMMLPWLAFGHLVPFYQLSIALAKSGIKVSFLSTPKNIQRLPKLPPHLNSLLNFISFPLPSLEDQTLLPPETEATVDIPFDKIQYLKMAYDLLQKPIKEFVKLDQTIDWIIIDMIPYWIDEVAKEFQIPVLHFSVFNAATYCFMVHPDYLIGEGQREERSTPETLTYLPKWIDFPSSLAYNIHEAIGFHQGVYGDNASGIKDAERIHKIIVSTSKAVIVRSCYEFEGEYLNLLEKNLSMPVIAIGLLPPEKPKGDSFKDRTCNRGLVSVGWVPQMEILGHPSIGGSLFHSGWGSVIETLKFGHCLVVLPFIIDQPLNAKLLVEKGLAMEIEKNEDGSFSREEIAKTLNLAMVSKEGESIRERSRGAAKIYGDHELHQSYIEKFVEYLKNGAAN